MLTSFEQAQLAAQRQDWALVYQCLCQMQIALDAEAGDRPLAADLLELVAEALLKVLRLGDFQQRWEIAKLFSQIAAAPLSEDQRSRLVMPWVAALQTDGDDEELCWFVARLLGEVAHPAAVDALAELLQQTEDDDVRSAAAASLASLGPLSTLALTELLAEPETRLVAVQTLAHVRSAAVVEPLLSVLDDPDPAVRSAALEALSSVHEPRVSAALVRALSDPASAVRKEAVIGLGLRADQAIALDLVPLLSPLLRDLNGAVAEQVAIALGRIGTPAAVLALSVQFQPLTPISQQIALVRALGWMKVPEALAALESILETAPAPVLLEAIAALGRTQEPRWRPKVAQRLQSLLSHPGVQASAAAKQAIALALGQLGDRAALGGLTGLLADEDAGVRLHAIAALKALDRTAAQQHLRTLAQDPQTPAPLRQGITQALQEWELGQG